MIVFLPLKITEDFSVKREKKMGLQENELDKIVDAFTTAFSFSTENIYKAGYQGGHSTYYDYQAGYIAGIKAEQIRLNPAISDGLRLGSSECGKELGSRGRNS